MFNFWISFHSSSYPVPSISSTTSKWSISTERGAPPMAQAVSLDRQGIRHLCCGDLICDLDHCAFTCAGSMSNVCAQGRNDEDHLCCISSNSTGNCCFCRRNNGNIKNMPRMMMGCLVFEASDIQSVQVWTRDTGDLLS